MTNLMRRTGAFKKYSQSMEIAFKELVDLNASLSEEAFIIV